MQLKDSLTNEWRAVSPKEVSIYACGITPYSSAHVGHARTYVVFDLLATTLRAKGHKVRLVRNITDIDDKIIKAANDAGVPWTFLAEHYAKENRELMLATGLTLPEEPYASHYVEEIFELTQKLLDINHAYVSPTGDVLYRVSAYSGALLMNHQEGSLLSEQGTSRVNAEGKEDLRDFALWKRTPEGAPGFASPWGWGRPGWHIECSAMISALFGGSVTIHGGGVDLKFPHHQAEIMQSEPVFKRPLAEIWMHNGSVTSEGKKMSKSLNNFVTWQAGLDLAEAQAPSLGADLLRFALLQAHWQKPLDWSPLLLASAKRELISLSKGLTPVVPSLEATTRFVDKLSDNLNTPAAFVWLREQYAQGNLAEVAAGLGFLGIDYLAWAAFKEPVQDWSGHAQVQELLAKRGAARAAKNWALSDELRNQLAALGYVAKDGASA